jgi:Intron-binding protein aquarius N-terminus
MQIRYIRGAEVIEIADESGVVLKDLEIDQGKRREGHARTMRLLLDPSQYQTDVVNGQCGPVSFLSTVKKNNVGEGKSVLAYGEIEIDFIEGLFIVQSYHEKKAKGEQLQIRIGDHQRSYEYSLCCS